MSNGNTKSCNSIQIPGLATLGQQPRYLKRERHKLKTCLSQGEAPGMQLDELRHVVMIALDLCVNEVSS